MPLGSRAISFKLELTWSWSSARVLSSTVAGLSFDAPQRWASATAEAIPTWHDLHGFRGAGSRPARGEWYRLAARRPVGVPARGPWPLAGLEVYWRRLQTLQRLLFAALTRLLSPVWAEPWSAAFAASRPLPTPPAGGLHSGYCSQERGCVMVGLRRRWGLSLYLRADRPPILPPGTTPGPGGGACRPAGDGCCGACLTTGLIVVLDWYGTVIAAISLHLLGVLRGPRPDLTTWSKRLGLGLARERV